MSSNWFALPSLFLFFISFFWSFSWLRAAPCCGGASLLPALITGDERAQLTLGLEHSQVVSSADNRGVTIARSSDVREITQIANLQGAFLVFDQIQVGATVPLVRRSYSNPGQETRGTGLGDVSLDVAYEFLPEFSYSPWKPRGFAYVKMLFPTGRSIYDGNFTEAYGKGFYILSLGTAFVKVWNSWDALISVELHRTFGRSFISPGGVVTRLGSGNGGSGIAALGWSPGRGIVRLGVSLSHLYEAGQPNLDLPVEAPSRWSWILGAQLGVAVATDWSIITNAYDQSFLQAKNVAVSQGFGLQIQRRFEP